jgi:hypothetical protein
MSDRQLIRYASERGYDVVAFVGRAALANPSVVEEATRAEVAIAVTSEEDPNIAERHLLARLDHLATVLPGHKFVVVRASDVIPYEQNIV